MQSNPDNTFTNLWPRFWPRVLIIIIGIVQMILAWIILGLQSGIVYVGIAEACSPVTARHVMGYICWIFFLSSSIANCCVSCCNRLSFACATYGLIENVLTFVFSCVLIDFNRKFIDNPLYDYGEITSSTLYCFDSYDDLKDAESISLSLNKAQLSAAVFMLLSSIAYMAIYVFTAVRAWMARDNHSTMNFNFSGNNVPHMTMVQPVQHMQYPHQPGYPMQYPYKPEQHMQHPHQLLPRNVAPPGVYMQTQAVSGHFHQHQASSNANEYAIVTPNQSTQGKDPQSGLF